jgi:hypothetical protein
LFISSKPHSDFRRNVGESASGLVGPRVEPRSSHKTAFNRFSASFFPSPLRYPLSVPLALQDPQWLPPQAKAGNQLLVAGYVDTTQVTKQATTPANQHLEPTLRGVVLFVGLHMLGEMLDA